MSVIRSRATLERVVNHLELARRWSIGRGEALAKLESKVETRSERANQIEVSLQDADRDLAVAVVDEFVSAYKDWVVAHDQERTQRAVDAMEKQITKYRQKAEASSSRWLEFAGGTKRAPEFIEATKTYELDKAVVESLEEALAEEKAALTAPRSRVEVVERSSSP